MKFIFFVLWTLTSCLNLYAETEKLLIEKVKILNINSTINPATLNYLENEIKLAEKADTLFIIKINTPGGLVTTTKDILTLIGKSKNPIAVWVTPEGASATSAGAIIASSSHFLFMNDGTNIGAATPIGLGEDIKESDARNKAIKDLVALVRSLSELRGRSADDFALMIEKAASYSSSEAAKKNIINGIATSLHQIQTSIEGKEIPILGEKRIITFSPLLDVKEVEMDLGQTLLDIFAHPTTAYMLFILGAALLYFELQAPGGYIAGSIGALCIVLSAIGFQVLPLNIGAFALVATGIALLVLELFITSYGALSIGGIISLLTGSLFLFRTKDSFLTIEYSVMFSTLFGILSFAAIITWYLLKHKKQNNKNALLEEGVVMNILSEGLYQVKVAGVIWKAKSNDELQINDRIQVFNQDKNQLLLHISKLSKESK